MAQAAGQHAFVMLVNLRDMEYAVFILGISNDRLFFTDHENPMHDPRRIFHGMLALRVWQ